MNPVANAAMLIRRPVAEVFEAFANPAITARFWFSHGHARLAPGAQLRWEWEMYGAGTDVLVKAIEPGRRILIDWDEPVTEVEWLFEPRGADRTWVTVENRGFHGTDEEKLARALDATGGFALVLAGAKIWLEHGIEPGFVLDRHPDAVVEAWKHR
ncbi:MAG TPA: SRPBCC family protein [Allosphingosinicella sp.]|nr:SRPBCC family protein [Allosphingosinicella sp.]